MHIRLLWQWMDSSYYIVSFLRNVIENILQYIGVELCNQIRGRHKSNKTATAIACVSLFELYIITRTR